VGDSSAIHIILQGCILSDSLVLQQYSPGSIGSFAKHSLRGEEDGGQSSFKPSLQAANVAASDFGTVELIALGSVEDVRNHVENAGMFTAFFIRQRHSYSPLLVTSSLFAYLVQTQNFSPQLNDYLIYLGEKEREIEKTPSRYRVRSLRMTSQDITDGGYVCMYGLRFVELSGRGSLEEPSK